MLFPLEVGLGDGKKGFVRKKVFDLGTYLDIINRHNTLVGLHQTINSYNDINDYSTVRLHNALFDIDDNYENSLKLHQYLLDKNIKHFIRYSSPNSYHIIVRLKETYLKNKKAALTNFQKELIGNIIDLNELKEEFKVYQKAFRGPMSDRIIWIEFVRRVTGVDMQVFGDLSQMSRIVNTWHLSTGNYCIPVWDMEAKDTHAKLARTPQHRFEIFGEKELSLHKYDKPIENDGGELLKDIELDENNNYVIRNLDICTQHMLLKPNPTHIERYVGCYEIIDFLAEGETNRSAAANRRLIAATFKILDGLRDENGKHIWTNYNPRITRQQVEYCVKKNRNGYDCAFKKRMGLCVGCEKDEQHHSYT